MKFVKVFFPALILSLVLSFQVSAQQKRNYSQEADQAFEDKTYNLAIEKYEKAYSKVKKNKVEKNRILFQIAECYRLTNNMKKAEAEYKRLDKLGYGKTNPLTLLYYANALKINEKYEDAIIAYNRYKELAPKDPRGDIGVESCTMAKQWKDNPTRYVVNPDEENHKELNAWKAINSKEDDFSPAIADEKGKSVIFTSSRTNSVGNKIDDWTGQSFSDLYITTMSSKGDWSAPLPLDDQNIINTDANEGNASFNAKFNMMYFTRCGQEKGKQLGCQVYRTERKGNLWGEPEVVKLGTDTTKIYGHPAISKDELTIYFASDMDGGYGGKDIWVATRSKKNRPFDTPKNLGPEVNTPGNELFPFLRTDSILYFSSDYHPGMGGLDIFRTVKIFGGKWSKPENMKSPVNSSGDDFGITFFPNTYEEKGYISSNRKQKGTKGGDDIYSFLKIPLVFTLQGVVKDDRTLQFLEGALVKMVGSDGTSVEMKTDRKGFYSFDKTQVIPATSYDLTVTREGYFSDKGRETTVGLENSKDFVLDFSLVPIPIKPVVLPEILYDLDKYDLKPQYQDSLQGLIQILTANPNMVIELSAHTDPRASDEHNDLLSQNRAQSVVDYLITRGIERDRLVAKGYGKRVPRVLEKEVNRDGFTFPAGVTLNEDYIKTLKPGKEQEAAYQLDRRTEFRILSMNFVPRPKIDTAGAATGNKINIVVNVAENEIPITPGENGTFEGNCVINGFAVKYVFDADKNVPLIGFSVDEALTLLTKGYISKTDFLGDVNTVLANSTIADKATFTIAGLRIGDKFALQNIEAIVLKDQKEPVKIVDALLQKISKYKVDNERKLLIFETH